MTSCNKEKCHFIDKRMGQRLCRDEMRYSVQVQLTLLKRVIVL